MRALISKAGFCVALVVALVAPAGGAPADPAARGLDAFVHGPHSVASGGQLDLEVQTLGFASVASPTALGGVTIDAAWDPESFNIPLASTPPAVHADSDAMGHAHISLPVPQGDAQTLRVLLGMHHGAHTRTRSLEIARTKAVHTEIHTSESRVVPGGTVNAWVRVTHPTSEAPIASADVEISLLEGTYARAKLHGKTDVAGMAAFRVPVPDSDDPTDSWSLVSTAQVGSERASAAATLTPRDETPGAPTLLARFDGQNVRAGDAAPLSLTLRDGTDTPVAGTELRYWVGQSGMKAPADEDAWLKVSTAVTTDLRGEVHAKAPAPKVVSPAGTSLHLVVRGELEGQKLEDSSDVPVTASVASVHLVPERTVLVAGLEQRIFVDVMDGRDQPIAGSFQIEGDGLSARVTTDAKGEAEFVWRVPAEIGAHREIGPCAGDVAATVRVRPVGRIEALSEHPDPFVACLTVDRETKAMLLTDKTILREGESLGLRVIARGATSPWSVTVGPGDASSRTAWLADGHGDVMVPSAGPGPYAITAVAPGVMHAARTVTGSVLVLPKTIPRVEAKIVGGRAAPGGTVDVEATLTDETGKPMQGSVTAVLVDLEGGGSLHGLLAMDTRTHLCSELGAPEERCDELLHGPASSEAWRRSLLAHKAPGALQALVDPGATAKADLERAFGEVLHSLEGAVYEASLDPDRLLDVRRKAPTGFSFNPELLTLTTAAMEEPPRTPGGEVLSLGDLTAIDPQVTFDNVARRVTRYKLYKVLSAIRTFRTAHAQDQSEPALRDPNAIVRRLVRASTLTQNALVDPWGGSMQFVKGNAINLPFLNAIPGWELHSPGPNGIVGDGDDVRDPFVRVVKSGSPYALATDEDALVDAKLDMEVADATITAWDSVFERTTGTHLGNMEGIGLGGVGSGGGGSGQGFGSGHGRLGGTSRHTASISRGEAFFGPPQRTDAQGHVHFHVPLGDIETTWGLGVLALADSGAPASTKIDIAASQPVSLAANAGAMWTTGDEMDVRVIVRNRTANAIDAKVACTFGGAAMGKPSSQTVHVAAQALGSFAVRVRTVRAGEAVLDAKLEGTGFPSDALHFTWNVLPSGEFVTRTAAQWVEGTADVQMVPTSGDVATGRARLVLSRGVGDALEGSLLALDPDTLGAPESLADSLEVAARIDRIALARGGDSELHKHAASIQERAGARLASLLGADHDEGKWALRLRLKAYATAGVAATIPKEKQPQCPPHTELLGEKVEGLGVAPRGDSDVPCWETLIAEASNAVLASDEPTTVARALLSLADMPSRAGSAGAVAERLRKLVKLAPSGAIRLDRPRRADRVLVYAALLRANKLGRSPVSDERLAAWLAVDRDAGGSFGSSEATRAVVLAMTASDFLASAPVSVTVESDGTTRTVSVGPSGVIALGLGEGTTRVRVRADLGVIARLERPMIRSFAHPPDPAESPLRLETVWPEDARTGHIAALRVTLGNVSSRSVHAVARIPLPPGAALAGPVHDVHQVHGALIVSAMVDVAKDATFVIPLRFSLGGHATIREARIVTPRAPFARGIAAAQSITVK